MAAPSATCAHICQSAVHKLQSRPPQSLLKEVSVHYTRAPSLPDQAVFALSGKAKYPRDRNTHRWAIRPGAGLRCLNASIPSEHMHVTPKAHCRAYVQAAKKHIDCISTHQRPPCWPLVALMAEWLDDRGKDGQNRTPGKLGSSPLLPTCGTYCTPIRAIQVTYVQVLMGGPWRYVIFPACASRGVSQSLFICCRGYPSKIYKGDMHWRGNGWALSRRNDGYCRNDTASTQAVQLPACMRDRHALFLGCMGNRP